MAAEFIGTGLLVAAVVGSGIMGERLAGGNVAIALLANTIATGAALLALISAFAEISGGSFQPGGVTGRMAARPPHDLVISSSYCGPDHWRRSRDVLGSLDVRSSDLYIFAARPFRGLSMVKRRRCHVRTRDRHPASRTTSAATHSGGGCGVYHRCLLVHGLDILRKSRSYHRAVANRQLQWHTSHRRSRVHRLPGRRWFNCVVAV